MAAELQSLLEKIQKEGVDRAESRAAQIEQEAHQKADRIVSDAEAKSKAMIAQAEQEGETFAVRGRQALHQAARDVILSVHDSISAALSAVVLENVTQALDQGSVVNLLSQVIAAYTADSGGNTPIEVLVPDKIAEQVKSHFMAELAEAMRRGLEVKADNQLTGGFRVSFVDQRIEHDFSAEAVSDALCRILRPHLAQIVKAAAEKKQD